MNPVKKKDLDRPDTITCSQCGKIISFSKDEVYINGPSYVCRQHANIDIHNGNYCEHCGMIYYNCLCYHED